jgi:hypothetical protein
MIDLDLASLYEVSVGRFNEAVKRNSLRFPDDFMFQLTSNEWVSLKSQIAISKKGRGGRRHFPYAFTEQGVAMLSSVLGSERAIKINISIMRAFVKLRRAMIDHRNLTERVEKVEGRLDLQETDIRYLATEINQTRAEFKKSKKKP